MSDPCAIMTTRPRVDLAVMSAADVSRIHEAALAYLEQVGIRVCGAAALAALAAAGAGIGPGTEGTTTRTAAIVKIPAALVEKALGLAPSTVVLGARSATQDVVLDGRHSLLATGAGAVQVRDVQTGERRSATSADLVSATRIADYLGEVAVVCPAVRALDAPQAGRALRELELCLTHSTKHIQLRGPLAAGDAEPAVAMALILAGSADELRARPPVSLRAGDDAALEAALVFAARGLPVAAVAGPVCAAAPADLQAALTLAHASVLAALSAVQSAAPGAPFLYCADAALLGWEGSLPGALRPLFALSAAQLAGHCGLPFVGEALATSSHEPDWQASTQNSFAALSGTLSCTGLVGGAGLLSGGSVFSAQQLVMDSEIFSVAAKIASGIAVDDDTIALETIKKVGIGGNYLGERHTRAYMKIVWRPRLLDRSPWDSWMQGGCQGSYDKAGELVETILETHQAEPPGALAAAGLKHIVEIADDRKGTT